MPHWLRSGGMGGHSQQKTNPANSCSARLPIARQSIIDAQRRRVGPESARSPRHSFFLCGHCLSGHQTFADNGFAGSGPNLTFGATPLSTRCGSPRVCRRPDRAGALRLLCSDYSCSIGLLYRRCRITSITTSLLESEDAFPVILHADDRPPPVLCFVVEYLREGADLGVG